MLRMDGRDPRHPPKAILVKVSGDGGRDGKSAGYLPLGSTFTSFNGGLHGRAITSQR